MDDDTRTRLVEARFKMPSDIRSPPASENQLVTFETKFEKIPSVYRWFLKTCGGGVIGPEWVDDIVELSRTHEKFASEFGPPRGWTMTRVFVIGWDGAGNPFGVHHDSGKLLVEDHNLGGIHEMAESIERFLIEGILGASG